MFTSGQQLSGVARRSFKLHNFIVSLCRSTVASPAVDLMDEFTARLVRNQANKWRTQFSLSEHETSSTPPNAHNFFSQDMLSGKPKDERSESVPVPASTPITKATEECIMNALSKNKHIAIESLLLECEKMNQKISKDILVKLFTSYSDKGLVDRVLFLQSYSERMDPKWFKSYGNFLHYIAKSHCLKGNSDKGLTMLFEMYGKNKSLRNMYRSLFRELIQDAVWNRSEASLVVFRRHIEAWSERWKDNYPLVCFWHYCWSSTWFSDQKLADELMDKHGPLREIIKDRAAALSTTALHSLKDDDAVVRLLQALLRHGLLQSYTKVLESLFHYRLINRDKRGCTEILRNCKALGVTLSSNLQGRYIHMVIDGAHEICTDQTEQPSHAPAKDFKLKF